MTDNTARVRALIYLDNAYTEIMRNMPLEDWIKQFENRAVMIRLELERLAGLPDD